MRAIRFVGHKKAAMERSARAHTARQCCCGFQNVWSAQTVTMGPDLSLAVNLALFVQERNVGQGVPLCRARREEWSNNSAILLPVGWIPSVVKRLIEQG